MFGVGIKVVVSQNRGTQCRPQYIRILFMGTPKRGPPKGIPYFGKPPGAWFGVLGLRLDSFGQVWGFRA